MALSAINWPLDLPVNHLIEDFDEKPNSFKIRTNMDAAIAKQRSRFSVSADTVSVRFLFTEDQYTSFKDFFTSTLKSGTLEFNIKIRGVSKVVRFAQDNYKPDYIGVYWKVTLMLEVIP